MTSAGALAYFGLMKAYMLASPIRQSAMVARDVPLFKRFVVEPNVNFKTVAVANTEHASAPLPKATVSVPEL